MDPPKGGFVTGSRTWGVQENIGYPPPTRRAAKGHGTNGAGPLRIILHVNNSRIASRLICKDSYFAYQEA